MSAPNLNPQSETVLHLPSDLARQIEEHARRQNTDAASVVEQAMRSYRAQEFAREVERLRASAPSTPYTAEDVPRLIAEFREEERRANRS